MSRGSFGNEFRELIRKLEKLDREPERQAARRRRAEAKKQRTAGKPQPSR